MRVKILFFIDSLHGGRGRILLNILQFLNREKFEPIFVLFKREGIYADETPDDIPVFTIPIYKVKRFCLPCFPFIIYCLRKILNQEKPLILFCYGWYGSTVSYLAGVHAIVRPKIVIHEDTVFSEYLRFYNRRLFNILIKNLIRFSYKRSDLIIAVSKGVKDNLTNEFNIPEEKIKVVHTPIDLNRIIKSSKEQTNHPWFSEDIPVISSAGRLVPQKGFNVLLKAFSLVRKNLQAKLLILGEGKSVGELERLRDQLALKNDVDFLGFQNNPWKYIGKSAVFAISSFYEGLPGVIIEALSLGIPVISTNCPSGPEEILKKGEYGILVPLGDEVALSEGLSQLLTDGALRERLSNMGKKRAMDFSVDKIIQQLETIMYECIMYKT